MTDDVITQLAAARTNPSIIMVVGVGGAGGNAVNHMWNLGIKGVDFMVCNTDQQALDKSPVELKVRLGSEGLGAGNDPENGRKAAIESLDVVRQRFEASGTKMVFITAGMGGGTGTGASPVIAKLAKEMGMLTVGIVTSPLAVEGKIRYEQAFRGIEELRQNVDFADVSKVMRDSGRAHMSVATAEGDNRAEAVAEASLHSPLLDHNLISGARNILLNISVANAEELMYEEVVRILEYIQAHASVEDESGNIHNANIIWGTSEKPQLGNAIELVVVATGFEGDEEKRMMKTVIPPARIVKPVPEGADPAGKPVLEPVGKPGKATPQTRPLEQVILGEKSTRYSNIDQILAKPAYQSRKAQFIVEMPAGRKEVLKEEKGAAERAEENRSESLFD